MPETMAPIKIVITGARGFVGMAVLRAFAGSGADVTAILRTGHEKRRLQSMGARVVVAGLTPGPVLAGALAGQDVLVNLAYDMRAGMDENLRSFEGLIGAAKDAGISRIVHVSSAVVYDDWPDGAINENSPITRPEGPSYRPAKIAMEEQLLASGFEVAILQPTIVFGPGSALWTTAPMAAMAAGGVVLPDPVGRCAAVHVDDVAAAIKAAVYVADLGRQRFLISGAETVGWDAFFGGYREILGKGEIIFEPAQVMQGRFGELPPAAPNTGPPLAARISASLRRAVGSKRFEQIQSKVAGLRVPTGPKLPDRQTLALYLAHPDVSIEKARQVLGYEPKNDFASGLLQIAQSR